MKNLANRTLSGIGFRVFVLALFLVVAQGAAGAANGVCVSADIEEPFRLPDGSDHPAGRLTLCHHSDYSPVASLHQAKVDGMTVGMHLSRRGESERDDSEEPFFMFAREADGTLLLLGYAQSGPGEAMVHAFPASGPKAREQLQAKARSVKSEAPVILLAANVD